MYAPCPPNHGSGCLNVEVQGELVRVRAQLNRFELFLVLIGYPGLDQVFGEYAALEQELVILLECMKNLFQASRCGFNFRFFLRREVVEVFVDGAGWRELLFHTVESGKQHGAECKIGVRRWVRTSKLDALGLLAPRVHWNADTSAAVTLRVHQIDRRFVARNQAAV